MVRTTISTSSSRIQQASSSLNTKGSFRTPLYGNLGAWHQHCMPYSLCAIETTGDLGDCNPAVSKDLTQNPDPSVKRGRVSSVDGSLPTFLTNSSLLHLEQCT